MNTEAAVDAGTGAIVAALITAAASICVAWIMARVPKREVHEVLVKYPAAGTELEPSRPPQGVRQVFRAIGWGIVFVILFVAMSLISMTIILWIVPADYLSFDSRDKKLTTVLFLTAAAFLFCIARWVNNRSERSQSH
jgi:hypothetical protein